MKSYTCHMGPDWIRISENLNIGIVCINVLVVLKILTVNMPHNSLFYYWSSFYSVHPLIGCWRILQHVGGGFRNMNPTCHWWLFLGSFILKTWAPERYFWLVKVLLLFQCRYYFLAVKDLQKDRFISFVNTDRERDSKFGGDSSPRCSFTVKNNSERAKIIF